MLIFIANTLFKFADNISRRQMSPTKKFVDHLSIKTRRAGAC